MNTERMVRGLLLAAVAGAAAPLPMDSLVGEVLARHPRAEEARWRPAAQEARVAGSRAWMAPSLQLSGRSDGEMALTFAQGIPWPGRLGRMEAVERRRLDMARVDSAGAMVELALSVREAVWMEWMAGEMVGVLDSQRVRAETLAEIVRRNQGAGMATASDAWLAQARLAQARVRHDQALRDLESARAMRESWTGPGKLPDPGELRASEWLKDSGRDERAVHRPDIESMRREGGMEEAMATASEGSLLPDLMVAGMAMRMSDGMPGWGAMVGISMPFAPWASGMARGEAAAARTRARVAQSRVESMARMARSESASHRAKALAALETLRLLDSAVVPGQARARADALERWRQGREMTSMVVAMDEMVGMTAMERIVQRQTYEVERARALAAAGLVWEAEDGR